MGEAIGFISLDRFPPFFSPAACKTPLPRGRRDRQELEHTCATPQPDMRVCDHSHAYDSRTWTESDFPSHQTVTGRPPTGLTATFPALFDGPLERRPSPR